MNRRCRYLLIFALILIGVYVGHRRTQSFQWQKEEEASALLDRPIVISLKRHLHRFELTKKAMEQAGFTRIERFEAIDGFNTDPTFFEGLGIWTGKPGKRGCAASHLLIWKDLLTHPEREFLFIAEDDMLPHSDFARLFPLYWGKTPKQFDIVLVGNAVQATANDPLVISQPSFCLHAYIISQAGAAKLLKLYQQLPKEQWPLHVIDIFLSRAMQNGDLNYYCYNSAPFPDTLNVKEGKILVDKHNGLCFQNIQLGTTIIAEEVLPREIRSIEEKKPEMKIGE